MNRRGFLTNLIAAGVSAAILPAAVTYSRKWVKPAENAIYVINPAWCTAKYEISYMFHAGVEGNIIPMLVNSRKPQPHENPFPKRLNFTEEGGHVFVPAFIKQ